MCFFIWKSSYYNPIWLYFHYPSSLMNSKRKINGKMKNKKKGKRKKKKHVRLDIMNIMNVMKEMESGMFVDNSDQKIKSRYKIISTLN